MLLLWLVGAEVHSSPFPGSEQPPAGACPGTRVALKSCLQRRGSRAAQKKKEGQAVGL